MAEVAHAYLAVNVRIGFPEFQGEKRTAPRKGFAFKTVNSFKVETSWKVLTNTAKFIVAKQLCFSDNKRVLELVKTGDPVYIEAGYNGTFNRYFQGFISEVLDDLPVVFNCEDNMYILKRTSVSKAYKSVKLEKLLKDILPSQFKIDAIDVELGSLLYVKKTVAEILTELKDNFGIYSYFVGDTLVSGKIYLDNSRKVKFTFHKNIIPGNDLVYRRKTDTRILVTMTSHLPNGKKIKASYGEADGEEQKLVCYAVESQKDVEALAKKEYDRLKIDGYKGQFSSFGIPFVQHGDTLVLTNPENTDKNGNFYADAVTYELDDNAALRQIVKPGPIAA